MNHVSKSPQETGRLARQIANRILKSPAPSQSRACVIELIGDLGAGKTTFSKHFIKSFKIKDLVSSPTFTIIRRYRIPSVKNNGSGNFKNIYHIDAYRVRGKDLLSLNFRKIVEDPKNILLVEWADRVKGIMPKGRNKIRIEMAHTKKHGERKIRIKPSFNRES